MAERDSAVPSRAPRSERRGCFFWGCATIVLVTVAVAGSVAVATYFLYRDIRDFSSAEAMPVVIDESQVDYPAALAKLDAIASAGEGRAGERAGHIVLTPKDFNSLIARHPRASLLGLPGQVRIRSESDRLIADVSIALEKLPGLSGRYLNGSVEARVKFSGGELDVEVVSATSPDGRSLPRSALDHVGDHITRELNQELGPQLHRFESIEVRDGELHLQPAPGIPSTQDSDQ